MERVFGFCDLDKLIERTDAQRMKEPRRVRSALESWVAVASCDPVPTVQTRPASEEVRQASGEG